MCALKPSMGVKVAISTDAHRGGAQIYAVWRRPGAPRRARARRRHQYAAAGRIKKAPQTLTVRTAAAAF